ncbi:MAG: hypothetical protein IPP78_08090 [Holophagaceae bacterium]|nr:hypothetical protein [Holophagaceae bacterium]
MKSRFLLGFIILIAGLLSGCSSSSSGPGPDPGPAGVAITAFTSSASQVNQGVGATLSWSINPTPATLTLDGVSLPVTQTSATVTPTRRQTYTLVATGGGASDTKTVTVVARGLSLLAGDPATAGAADGNGVAARFNRPIYVSLDAQGNAFISDASNHAIRKVTSAGVVTTVVGTIGSSGYQDGPVATAKLNLPRGNAFDAGGNLYVMDAFNQLIRKVSGGVVSTLCGTLNIQGSLDGAPNTALFYSPNGMTMDHSGNLIVTDSNNHTIRKVSAAGFVTTLAGTAGVTGSSDGSGPAASFGYVTGPAVDPLGNIFVADEDYQTIRKITPAGQVTTFAGTAGLAGSVDGLGIAARFHTPVQISIDGSSNLYVADAENGTIRKITSGGQVSTIVGQPGVQDAAPGPFPASLREPLGVAVLPNGDLVIITGHAVFVATAP